MEAEDASSSSPLSPSLSSYSTSSPSIMAISFNTPLLAMDIEGLLVKDLENNSRAQDHWSSTTSRLVRNFWDSKDQQGFAPISTTVNYKGVELFTRRNLRDVNKNVDPFDKNPKLPKARIIYALNFEVRADPDASIPEELLAVPTTQSYIGSLRENDPTAFFIFQNVNATISRGIYEESESSSFAPLPMPIPAPSASFPTPQSLHNREMSETMRFIMVFLITCSVLFGLFSLNVMFQYFPKGDLYNICCFKDFKKVSDNGYEEGETDTVFPVGLPELSFSNDTL